MLAIGWNEMTHLTVTNFPPAIYVWRIPHNIEIISPHNSGMNIRFLIFCVLTFSIAQGAAEPWKAYKPSVLTFYGCGNYVNDVASFTKTGVIWEDVCSNLNALGTVMSCFIEVGRNTTNVFKEVMHYCEEYSFVTMSLDNFTDGYNNLMKNGVTLSLLNETHYNKSQEQLSTPVFLDKSTSLLYVRAEQNFLDIYTHSTYFGIGAVGYWVVVCLVGAVINWSVILFPNLRYQFNGPIGKFWRQRVALPALIGKMQATAQNWSFFSFLIPSRLETVVSFGFFVLLVGFNAAELKTVDNDPIFPSKSVILLRYIADRTGIICTILIPVLLLFGGRNNFMMWITRWKYSTFMTYHRWIGRWIVLMAFIHSVCYSEVFILEDEYSEEMAETYVVWGIVATTCGALILFQGLLVLRRKWYEIFFILHILLAIFFVVGTWYHVYELGYAQFMYACFAVWAFDRLLRAIRLVSFGFPEAQINLLVDRLEIIVPKPSYWKPTVGGYAWLYFGDKALFWQSHPFTYISGDNEITFYCKIHSGATYTLFKRLSMTPGGSLSMRVGVDGPYGASNPVTNHSDVVFVAGGSGIPGILDEFKDLAKNVDSNQTLKLNWVVRDAGDFRSMSKHFGDFSNQERIEVNVYVSRQCVLDASQVLEASKEADLKQETVSESSDSISVLKSNNPSINFFSGRPVIKDIVKESISNAGTSVAFVCCGPTAMVDEMRYEVVNSIDQTEKRIDFYDTLEVWA